MQANFSHGSPAFYMKTETSELSEASIGTSTYLGAEHNRLAHSVSQACSVIDLHLH